MGKLIFLDQRRRSKERKEAAKKMQDGLSTEEKLKRDGHTFSQSDSDVEKLIKLAKNTAKVIQNKQLGEGYTDGLDD